MSAKVFFTSDTHFNHANVIKYCVRPFASIEEMNRVMIERWNAVVGPEDTVYHLGDFAMGKPSEWPAFLRQLNGAKKILIRGNHDRSSRQTEKRLEALSAACQEMIRAKFMPLLEASSRKALGTAPSKTVGGGRVRLRFVFPNGKIYGRL
jgi:calcineurin-like phosphoesterase family protein